MSNAPIATVVIVGGTTALRVAYDPKVNDKAPAIVKVALGAFIAGALLTWIDGSTPELAIAMAWLLCVAALMLNGAAIMHASSNLFRT